MTVQCITCRRWQPRKAVPDLAKLGYGYCEVHSISKGHTFFSTYQRDCASHAPAPQDVIDARIAWNRKTA